jgi:hypothetical protein
VRLPDGGGAGAMTSNNAGSASPAAVLSGVGMSPLVTNRSAGYGSKGSFSMFLEKTSVCKHPS